MSTHDQMGALMSDGRWRAAVQRASEKALDIAPSIIEESIPFIGAGIAKGMDGPELRKVVFDRRMKSLLADLSNEVDGFFKRYGDGQSEFGLDHEPVSVTKDRKMPISQAVALWLNSLSDKNKSPARTGDIGIALLYERLWQSKDAARIYRAIQDARFHEAIGRANGLAEDVLKKAIHLQQHTLKVLESSESLGRAFSEHNGGITIPELRLTLSNDLQAESDIVRCMVHQIAEPKENVKEFLALIRGGPFDEPGIATGASYPGAGAGVQPAVYPVQLPVNGKGSPGFASNKLTFWRYPLGAEPGGLIDLTLMDRAFPAKLDVEAPFESTLLFEGDRLGNGFEDESFGSSSKNDFQP